MRSANYCLEVWKSAVPPECVLVDQNAVSLLLESNLFLVPERLFPTVIRDLSAVQTLNLVYPVSYCIASAARLVAP